MIGTGALIGPSTRISTSSMIPRSVKWSWSRSAPSNGVGGHLNGWPWIAITTAGTAHPFAVPRPVIDVLFSPRMATGAGRFQDALTSSTQILFARDSLKMIRVDAGGIPTQMVDVVTIGDLTIERLVRHSMGVAGPAANTNPGVAAAVRSALPDPAASRRLDDPRLEPCLGSSRGFRVRNFDVARPQYRARTTSCACRSLHEADAFHSCCTLAGALAHSECAQREK